MLSLYIHIPFCEKKCSYCSFDIIECKNIINFDIIKKNYLNSLKNEINKFVIGFDNKEIKSIYFGGGTPGYIGSEGLIEIIDLLYDKFDLTNLGELSIELNPYPENEVLEVIKNIQSNYKQISRIRWSIGLQTFDVNILKQTGRMYSFPAIVDFLRNLQNLKKNNTVFNFDFIAFGLLNQNKNGDFQLWDEKKIEFFENFVESGFADSFSLYYLEILKGSQMYHNYFVGNSTSNTTNIFGSEENIYQEYQFLKEIILESNYKRYEVSNFCKTGKESIHNLAYWHMENYIGFGVNASSFVDLDKINETNKKFLENYFDKKLDNKGIRWTNTYFFDKYLKGEFLDKKKLDILDEKDYMIEKFFLKLRTNDGIFLDNDIKNILVKNHIDLINKYNNEGLVNFENGKLTMTDKGMDIGNNLVAELLEEV